MRRAFVFALFMVPAIIWAALQVWTQGILARADWSTAAVPHESLLLFVSHWVARDLMFAMLVLMVAAPACSAAIARVAGTLRESEATKAANALLWWWSVSVASLALFLPL